MNFPEIQAGSTIQLTETATWADDGLPVDLTSAELLEFEVLPPGGAAVLHWPATAVGLPAAGVLAYTTTPSDCVIPGIWQAHAHIVTAGGGTYRTDERQIEWRVRANLPGA